VGYFILSAKLPVRVCVLSKDGERAAIAAAASLSATAPPSRTHTLLRNVHISECSPSCLAPPPNPTPAGARSSNSPAHVNSTHGQSCSRAHRNTSSHLPRASKRKRSRNPWAPTGTRGKHYTHPTHQESLAIPRFCKIMIAFETTTTGFACTPTRAAWTVKLI
jgi:hypothetical protein